MRQKHITKESLIKGIKFPLNNFELTKEHLIFDKWEPSEKKFVPMILCDPLFIKEKVQNLDTQYVNLILTYWFNGKFQEVMINMGELVPNELLKLTSKGVNVPHSKHKLISDFLIEQQKKAPHRDLYRNVGWHYTKDKELYFRHEKAYPQILMPDAMIDDEDGLYNLQPMGDLGTWVNMVREQVQGNIQLEFVLAAGFSSVIVGALYKMYDDVDSLLIHLAGDSTQGKTTAALLAVSPFGPPSNKIGGLQKTWNGTANATINSINGNYGIPLIFDELSMSRAKSITSDIYVLTSGQEKARLTDQIKQRKQGTWSTTLFSTGEQSLFERTSQNVGLTVRAFEFSNITWTNSAAHADKIKGIVQENYGHAGIEFIKYIVRDDTTPLVDFWVKWEGKCIETLEESPFRSRIAKKYGMILAAAELANLSLDLALDVEGILAFISEYENEKIDQRDIGKKGLRFMNQFIIENQKRFKIQGYGGAPNICYGKVAFHPPYVEVSILKNILFQTLRDAEFEDPRAVVKDWDKKGLLIRESDRMTKRTQVFDDDEQHIREKMNQKKITKKEDTTYTLKLHLKDDLDGLVSPLTEHDKVLIGEEKYLWEEKEKQDE